MIKQVQDSQTQWQFTMWLNLASDTAHKGKKTSHTTNKVTEGCRKWTDPHTKSVCGLRWVRVCSRHLLLLMFKQGRISLLFGDPLGRAPSEAAAFSKWSDVEGSGLKNLTVCCPNPSLLKGFNRFWVSRDLLWFYSSVLWCQLTLVWWYLLAAVP